MESLNLSELNNQELLSIDGGSWLSDLGAAAHEKWNELQEWYCSLDTSAGYTGGISTGSSIGRNY